jgi:hypothetical protein
MDNTLGAGIVLFYLGNKNHGRAAIDSLWILIAGS